MLVLKKMNIHILFTHWFLSDFPFLTEEHPLGFKETGRSFKRNESLVVEKPLLSLKGKD